MAPPLEDVGSGLVSELPTTRYAPGAVAPIGFGRSRAAFEVSDYATCAAGMRGVIEGAARASADEMALAPLFLAAAELRIDPRRARDAAKRARDDGPDPELAKAYLALAEAVDSGRGLVASDGGWSRARSALDRLGDHAVALVLASLAPDDAAPTGLRERLEAGVDSLGLNDVELAARLVAPGALGGWVVLRRAALLYHIRRVDDAREALESFLGAYATHPGGARAKALYGAIAARTDVDRRKVGVLLPLSGGPELLGKAARTAIEIAFAGKPYDLVFKDTRGEEAEGRRLAEELVLEGAIAILGPIGSKSSRAAALKAEEYGVPLLSLSLDPDLTTIGSWIFRFRASRAEQARAIARRAVEVDGIKKFGILYPADAYGNTMMRAFWDEVIRLGGEVVAVESFLPGAVAPSGPAARLVGRGYGLAARARDVADLRRELKERFGTGTYAEKKLKEMIPREIEPIVEFDALFIPEDSSALKFALPHLNAMDIEWLLWPDRDAATLKKKHHGKVPRLVRLLGTSGWKSSMWAKKEAEHLLKIIANCTFVDTFFERDTRVEAATFVSEFESRSGKTPSSLAAQAHDVAAVLVMALERGGRDGRGGVRRALLNVKDFAGASGTLTMRPSGAVTRTMVFLTVDELGTVMTREAYEASLKEEEESSSP